MNIPFFSIIIPTYNRASLLEESIKSIVNQSFTDWELIIIDDGSTDSTKQVVDNYSQFRVQYYYQKNRERSAARNKGIQISNGKYLIFLDDDDLFLGNHLQSCYDILKDEESCKILMTGVSYLVENEIIEGPLAPNGKAAIIREIWYGGWSAISFVFQREILDNTQFKEEFVPIEDFILIISVLAQDYSVQTLPKRTAIIREHPGRSMKTSNLKELKREIDSRLNGVTFLSENYHAKLVEFVGNNYLEYRKKRDLLLCSYKAIANRHYLFGISLAFKVFQYKWDVTTSLKVIKRVFMVILVWTKTKILSKDLSKYFGVKN